MVFLVESALIAAIDTETTGTDPHHGCRPFMVVACTGQDNYIWEGEVLPGREVYWKPETLAEIQDFINSCDRYVFHNARFDLMMLHYIGIKFDFDVAEDTMLMSHCLHSGEKLGLKDLAIRYFNWHPDEEDDLRASILSQRLHHPDRAQEGHSHFPGLKSGPKTRWWKMDLWMDMEACRRYAFGDVERTILLYETLLDGLQQENLYSVYRRRQKLIEITFDMELRGFHIDKQKLQKYVKTLDTSRDHILQEIKEKAGIPYTFNPAKTSHLQHLIHGILKIEPSFFTEKTGKPQMNKEAISFYVKNYENEELELLQTYQNLTKRQQMAESLIRWERDSRIHSTIWITGTRATRRSSSDPNQQNIDNNLNKFLTPTPGHYILDVDLVNIELRIWAYLTGNQDLIQTFERGESVHLLIAKELHPYDPIIQEGDPAKYDKHINYKKTKNGNFSLIYGASPYKANKTYGVGNAYEIIEKKFPEITAFIKQTTKEAYDNKERYGSMFVTTLGGYRVEVAPNEPYKAANCKIQGSAGIIMAEMMTAYHSSPESVEAPIVQEIHDSLKFEIRGQPREELHKRITSLLVGVGEEYIPTCPVSYKVVQ